MYDPAKHVTDVLKGLCGSEQACEICLFKDEITSTLLSPISHFLDVAVSIGYTDDYQLPDHLLAKDRNCMIRLQIDYEVQSLRILEFVANTLKATANVSLI